MEPSLIFVFLFIAYAFEQDVGLVGFFDCHHLYFFVFEANHLWKREFADLALEFSEIVALNDVFNLFLDLAVDPGAEAPHVNQSAAALAIAGRY